MASLMASLTTANSQLTHLIQSYLQTSDNTTTPLAPHLQTLGDLARSENERVKFTKEIPPLLLLINHKPYINIVDLALAIRAIGNLVVDNDVHRQICLEHQVVPIFLDIFDAIATKKNGISSTAKASNLERNLLGAIGNLVCDNKILQNAFIEAGIIPFIVQSTVNGRFSKMASNAACCFESPNLLSSIAFYNVNVTENGVTERKSLVGLKEEEEMDKSDNSNNDNLGGALLPKLNGSVIECVLETMIDLVDEKCVAYEKMKQSNIPWADNTIHLTALVVEEMNVLVSNNTTEDIQPFIGALHTCGGFLSRAYQINGENTFTNMNDDTLSKLSQIIYQMCHYHSNSTINIASPELSEALGIFNGALANVCGNLDGCLRIFQVGAEKGLVASACIQLDQNKGIQSGGLVALRNLCLAAHQQQNQMDEKKETSNKGDGDSMSCGTSIDTVEFCSNACEVAFNGCKHDNVNMSLAGIGALRQAIGNTKATPNILDKQLTEELWDWVLSGFTHESLAQGNKGQCECARIVCVVIIRSNQEKWDNMLGKDECKLMNINRCIALLQKFNDSTLTDEASQCIDKMKEFGV
jgi:hypothetical protein